jgi:uncharacterized protein
MTRALRASIAAWAAVLALFTAHEIMVPVQGQFATRAALTAIKSYRRIVSPRLNGVVSCRFVPSCSRYGLDAVEKYGGYRGTWKAVTRIARCTPLTPVGTVDLP